MLVNDVGSRKEGAISSNLVHPVCEPVRRAFTEKREGSEEKEMVTNLKGVSTRMTRNCKPPLNLESRLILDQLSETSLKRYRMIFPDAT